MNIQQKDILKTIITNNYHNQRGLSEESGYSLGVVNKSLHELLEKGFITEDIQMTDKAQKEIRKNSPRNAIIMAAGLGMRMVPINAMTPKGLLEVDGEPLVERLIVQLNEAGIEDITIIVGFMKEKYEYLIDEYGVELVVNPDYAKKNNLASLFMVMDRIENTYVIPCDVWCGKNPFSKTEMYSWYMVSDLPDEESDVKVNRKLELVKVPKHVSGNEMIGIAYIAKDDAPDIRKRLKELYENGGHDEDFWEEALYKDGRMTVAARVASSKETYEINTYEQLRALDDRSNQLESDAIKVIADVLKCNACDITNIELLKKGMTNRSFMFSADNRRYIMRIPGEGTDQLINRKHEAEVFEVIKKLKLCDQPEYIDPDTGYKITRFLEDARPCNPYNWDEVRKCMDKLKVLHKAKIKVGHAFDIFGQIDFYEKLWNGIPSAYRDYEKTKDNILSLKQFLASQKKSLCLTHIDAIPDNFLFYDTPDGEELQLTDWEYAGMQDPHVDIAMFAIYSYYDKEQVDKLIDIYFDGKVEERTRIKIYCYIAMCGLLWSNWTEYKSTLGIEFGDYGLKQYRYAKEYYKYVQQYLQG